MSTTTTHTGRPGASAPGTLDLSGTQKIGFLTLVRVELRKAVDTRAGLWLLITTGLFAALGMGILLAVGLTEDLTLQFGTFFATTGYTTGVLLPVLGILLVTSEWSQRTAMVTFTTEPRRMLVVLAKLVAGLVLALAVAVVATVIAAVCNLLYGAISGDPVSWSLGDVSVVGFLVTQGIAMLAGFALATIMLSTPAAIVLFFVYTFVLPAVFALGSAFVGWIQDIQPWLDFSSAQQPLIDWSLDGQDWAHLAVSGLIWLVLPLALGLLRILRAEVK